MMHRTLKDLKYANKENIKSIANLNSIGQQNNKKIFPLTKIKQINYNKQVYNL